ncbi:hypothetical protein D9M68_651480 [compost metagenome]
MFCCTLVHGADSSGHFCIPQGYAIMVFGGDDRIAGTTFFDELHPLLWVILCGGKALQLLHVGLVIEVVVIKSPGFRNSVYRIDSPMNKNAQFGFTKPVHFIGF